MSRKTGKLTYAVKPASLSQTDFERQYPFDKKVKAFLGFPIVNFLNYHEGEISIIAYNKKQGIATYDHLLMETLVNTARIVSYLMDLAISNNRILNDLETAHETQSQLLPKNDPQIPGLGISLVKVSTATRPAATTTIIFTQTMKPAMPLEPSSQMFQGMVFRLP